MGPDSQIVGNRNDSDMRSMSLVHRSWTSHAQRRLKRRALVHHTDLEAFLHSPVCGPCLTELIVYWMVVHGWTVILDLRLLEAVLMRAPNIRSLAFNTSLNWYHREEVDYSDLGAGKCIELFSLYLPNLEKLWLRHFQIEIMIWSP